MSNSLHHDVSDILLHKMWNIYIGNIIFFALEMPNSSYLEILESVIMELSQYFASWNEGTFSTIKNPMPFNTNVKIFSICNIQMMHNGYIYKNENLRIGFIINC